MSLDSRGAPIPEELARRYRASAPRYAGQCGVLYDGLEPATGRPVLVKVLREDAIASVAERQRIQREAQKLTQVSHPGLAAVIAVGEDKGRLWIVREMVAGESLSERLSRGPMSVPEAARVAAQLAAALGELHRHGVLHRDVRPGHVILEPSGAARLIDAAVARLYRTPDGRASTGTPGYVAPESIAGKLVSFRSDLYSLGATLYEMLTGAPPYGPPDAHGVLNHQADNDAPMLRVPAPPALAKLIASLLSREPRERPFSAQQLERQLEPLAGAMRPSEDGSEATIVAAEGMINEDDEATMMLEGGTPHSITSPRTGTPSSGHASPPDRRGDFDDEQPTGVTDSPLSNPALRAAAASGGARPMSGTGPRPAASSMPQMPATRAPTPAPMASAMGHKSTMMGFSQPPGQGAPSGALAAAPAPVTTTATRAAPPNEGSGRIVRPPRDANADDFEESLDTVVTEDSRIFGVPAPQSSGYGTAVPPLPDGVAARVLTGSVRPPAPDAYSPVGTAAPPMQPQGPGAQQGWAPAPGAPSPQGAQGNVNPFQAALANRPPSQTRLPTAAAMGFAPPAQSGANPAAPPNAYPPNPYPPNAYPPNAYPPNAMPPQGYAQPQGGPYPPNAGPQGYPPPASFPGMPPGFTPGGFAPPSPAAVQPNGEPTSRRTILPWILAAIGVAGIAGAAGYRLSMHDRTPAAPAPVTAPPVVPHPVVPVVPPHPLAVAPTTGVPVVPAPVAPAQPVARPPAVAAHTAPTPPIAPTRAPVAPVVTAPAPVAPTPAVAPAPAPVPAAPPPAANTHASQSSSQHSTSGSSHTSSSHSSSTSHTTTTRPTSTPSTTHTTTTTHPRHSDPFVPTFGAPVRSTGGGHPGTIRR